MSSSPPVSTPPVSTPPVSTPLVSAPAAVEYPCSDGRPIAESEFQFVPLTDAVWALRGHFARREDVYVVGNMFIYYREGKPRYSVGPDLFVVIGAPTHWRDVYKLWEEPKGPDFVLEVTSRLTRRRDQREKRHIYASLGVSEYWLFDPRGEWLDPRLQGWTLHEGEYRAIPPMATGDEERRVHSAVLGLDVRVEADEKIMRFHDPATGEDLIGAVEAPMRQREMQALHEAVQARLAEETAAREEETTTLKEETAAFEEVVTARQAAEACIEEGHDAAHRAAKAHPEEATAAHEEETTTLEEETAAFEEVVTARQAAEACIEEGHDAARRAVQAHLEAARAHIEAARAHLEGPTAAREAAEARLAELGVRLRRSG